MHIIDTDSISCYLSSMYATTVQISDFAFETSILKCIAV